MLNLKLVPTNNITKLTWPKTDLSVTLTTPAMHVYTDFTVSKPLVLEISTTAVEADKLMRKAHVRFKIIINETNEFLGVVSSEELSEQALVSIISQGTARENIILAEVMIPRNELNAFNRKDVEHATVGDIIEALKNQGQQHC